MAAVPRSSIEQFYARLLPEAVLIRDIEETIPSTARRRRSQVQQGVLFGVGVFLGIFIVLATDLDRAFVRAYAPQQPIVFEVPGSRRVARHVHKDPPRGSSSRAIPTLDIRELPNVDE
jgi:hypothetical protein